MTLCVDGNAVLLTPGAAGFASGGMAAFFRAVRTLVDSRAPPEYGGSGDEELVRMAAVGPKHGVERLAPLPPAE